MKDCPVRRTFAAFLVGYLFGRRRRFARSVPCRYARPSGQSGQTVGIVGMTLPDYAARRHPGAWQAFFVKGKSRTLWGVENQYSAQRVPIRFEGRFAEADAQALAKYLNTL